MTAAWKSALKSKGKKRNGKLIDTFSPKFIRGLNLLKVFLQSKIYQCRFINSIRQHLGSFILYHLRAERNQNDYLKEQSLQ